MSFRNMCWWMIQLIAQLLSNSPKLQRKLPDSAARMARTRANSKAVTHLCLSTSLLDLRWKVWAPPLTTKLHESSVWIKAPWRLMEPRQVWPTSAWVLKNRHQFSIQNLCKITGRNFTRCYYSPFQRHKTLRDRHWNCTEGFLRTEGCSLYQSSKQGRKTFVEETSVSTIA